MSRFPGKEKKVRFGWINLFGAVAAVILAIPAIVRAARCQRPEKNRTVRAVRLAGWAAGLACMVLLWLPLIVGEFGFDGVFEMMLYLAGNGLLLLAYLAVSVPALCGKRFLPDAVPVILAAAVFLWSGMFLRHWLLVGCAVLFAAATLFGMHKDRPAD